MKAPLYSADLKSHSFVVMVASVIAAVLFFGFSGCSVRDPSTVRSDAKATSMKADSLRVMAYNIHHGEGMDDKLDLYRIASLIKDQDPDVVTLQEVDSLAARTQNVDQAVELGRLTGMTPVFGSFMPYDGGAYGMAVLTRWPLVSSKNIRLPDGDEPRTALSVVVSSPQSGQCVRVVGIHFYRTEQERMAQTLSLEEQLPDDGLTTILAGDFNSEPNSAVITHLRTNWQIVDKGKDHLTFSSFDPVKEIDFHMYRPNDSVGVIGQYLLDEPVFSDHRPLVVDFVLRKSSMNPQCDVGH